MTFYAYQRAVADDESRMRIILKSRQIGFSFLFAFIAFGNALFRGRNQVIVSASERQSRVVMRYVEKFIQSFSLKMKIKLTADSKTEKRFANGAMVYTLPQSPATIRGVNGDVFLDEFALHKNDREIYEAIMPAISRGYNITLSSTPLGQSNLFYEIFTDEMKYPDYRRFKFDVFDAASAGAAIDIDMIRRNLDEESFRQEYCCEFIDEKTSYFPYTLLRSAIGDPFDSNERYIGIDIGRKKDLTAVYVLGKSQGRYCVLDSAVLSNLEYSSQYAELCRIMDRHNVVRACIDATGIGNQLAEDLHRRYHQLEPVMFTNQLKERLVLTVKKMLEERKITLPDDRELIGDFHKIKRSVTISNAIRFDSDHTAGHSDRFWAVALAVNAAELLKKKIIESFII